MVGRKYDKMAAKKNQHYYFIFVHENGTGLERISEFFVDKRIEASVDQIFKLNGVKNQKVAVGRSKGKPIFKIAE